MIDFFLDPIIFVGFLVSLGISLSFVFQKLQIPHIVVYILTGFILANTLFKGIDLLERYEGMFEIVEFVALGLIGFKIGTELRIKSLSDKAKRLLGLVLGNTVVAFVLVSTFIFIFAFEYSFTESWVLALILGGVATATAPAATVEIIRKYKSKGVLTSLVLAVLALNDLVAIILIEVVLVIIRGSFSDTFGISSFFIGIWQEIFLAIFIGIIIGLALDFIVEKMHDDLEMMELTLGILIFTIGVAHFIHTSVILTTMVVGATVTNRKGENYEQAGDLLEVIMSPVVTLFFVLVGAKITFGDFNPFPFLVIVYFVVRIIGKYFGSYFAAFALGETEEVRQNFGLTMVPQGGIALGLVSIIGETLVEVNEDTLATIVISVIVIGTVFSEIIGTVTSRIGLTRAGDIDTSVKIEEKEFHQRTVHYHD